MRQHVIAVTLAIAAVGVIAATVAQVDVSSDATSEARTSAASQATPPLTSRPAGHDSLQRPRQDVRQVALADGRTLPVTHPDVIDAIRHRSELRRELRLDPPPDEDDGPSDAQPSLSQMLAPPDGQPRPAGQVSCEHPDVRHCDAAVELLASLPFDWTDVGWAVAITDVNVDDWLGGLARSSDKTLYLFADDTWGPWTVRRVLIHELGHAVDHRWHSPTMRDQYRAARNIPDDADDRAGGWPHDHSAVSEDFAELFAVWVFGGTSKSPWPLPDNVEEFVPWLWPPGCPPDGWCATSGPLIERQPWSERLKEPADQGDT